MWIKLHDYLSRTQLQSEKGQNNRRGRPCTTLIAALTLLFKGSLETQVKKGTEDHISNSKKKRDYFDLASYNVDECITLNTEIA